MGTYEDRQTRGTIFNIQKYSVHDGPGIRTIVFTKGCPLRCRWCSNPESQQSAPELAVNAGRCLTFSKCHYCTDVCPNQAIAKTEKDTPKIDRSKCAGCDFPCARACPAQGLLVYGSEQTVEEALAKVEQDAMFYARSKGGLTISGGEPLLHRDFALALLREARRRRLRTAIETCGMIPWETLEEASPLLTTVLFDVKHIDPEIHREQTGQSNEHILENLHRLAALDSSRTILVRTPVVPGFNDNEGTISKIAELVKALGDHVQFEMLPYHRLGTQKYSFLDRIPPLGEELQLDMQLFADLQQSAQKILGDRFVRAH